MAVYTTIQENILCPIIFDHYSIEIDHLQPIDQGISDSNYLLTDRRGVSYILKIYENKDILGIQAELYLLEHLYRMYFPVPRLYPTNIGLTYINLSNKYACLCEYIKGESGSVHNIYQLQELGSFVRRFHTMNRSFDSTSYTYFQNEIFDLDLTYFLNNKETSVIDETLGHFNLYGWIHGDLFPDNTLFRKDKLIGVIDFGEARKGSYYFELGVIFLSWCVGKEIDQKKIRAFMEIYNEYIDIPYSEDWIIPWIKVSARYFHNLRKNIELKRNIKISSLYLNNLEDIFKRQMQVLH